jgi:RHS repeat-associated protein
VIRLKYSVVPTVVLAFGLAGTASAAALTIATCGNTVPYPVVGSLYQVTFTVAGASPPVRWSTSGVAGLQIPMNGDAGSGGLSATLTGIPTGPTGSGSLVVDVSDAAGNTGTASFPLFVDPAGSPSLTGPLTSPLNPLIGTVGQLFTVQVNGAGTPPLTFGVGSSPTEALPPGLGIQDNSPTSNSATISGTPTAAATYSSFVYSGDGQGTNFRFVCFNINPAEPAVSFSPLSLPTSTTTVLNQSATTTGFSSTPSLSVVGTLPTGLTFTPATGTIAGTIPVPGAYSVTVQATAGSQMATAAEEFHIAVACDCPPTAHSVSSANGAEAADTATGGLGDPPVDLNLGGGPLAFFLTRSYSTELEQSSFLGALGANWMHNFEVNLAAGETAASVTLFGGKQVQFVESAGTWLEQAPEQGAYELGNTANGYHLLDLSTNRIYDFSSAGALTGFADRNGNTLTVTQGTYGPTSVADGLGRTLTFSYNAAGQLIKVSDQTGRSVQYAYTGTNLSSFTDANGGVTNYSYTAAGGLLTSTMFPAGNTPATNAYNANSQVQSITDSFHNTTAFSYNANAGQTTITDALANQTTDTNLDSYVLTKQTDALNHTSSIAYDSNLRPTLFTDKLGNQTSLAYLAAAGYPASVTDAQGHTTTLTYAAQIQGAFTFYNLATVSFADGTSISFTYDGSGNCLSGTDQAGNVTSMTYNGRGQVLTTTNPAGGVATVTYNADGTPASSTDPAGNVTGYAYDSLKRLIQITFADGATSSWTYDALGRVLTSTDGKGNVTTLVYDANGNPTRVTDPLRNSSTAAFDADDRVTSTTDPLGNTTAVVYNPVSNPQSVTDAAGETTTLTYDALNRVTSVADSAGNQTTFGYDADGNATSVADPLSNTTSFVIDQLRRVTQATTPLGETSSRSFDSLGRVTSVTNPLLQATNFSYDPRGLVNQISAPLGISASLAHDKLGNLAGITDPNGNTWLSQHDSSGRLMSKTDPLGQAMSFGYDARNRLNQAASSLGSAQISYDAAGNLTQMQYTDGTSKNYTYDADDRLLTANGLTQSFDAAGDLTSSNGLIITWDSVHRMASVTYAPGKTVTYTYNSLGLLATVSDWASGSIALSYDAAGRLISITRSNGITTQYAYDKDSRTSSITEATSTQTVASIAIQHDADGNVTSETRNVPQQPNAAPGISGLTYNAAEQVAGESYDAVGRLTNDSLRGYTWDLASELIAYNGANGSASSQYDGFRMRTSRTSGGTTQSFVLNYALGLPSIATVQSGGADQRYYIYTPSGALLYAIDASGNGHHWYHFDEVGSTTFLTSDSGQITDSYGITPYGESVTVTGSTPNPFTWLGRWGVMQEGSSGLYYMRSRYYDSASARFLSRDSMLSVDPLEVNPYQYAAANPLGRADPMGSQDVLIEFIKQDDFPNTVPSGNLHPAAPDILTFSVGLPLPTGLPVGAHCDVSIDKYFDVYVGAGPAVGVGANSFGASAYLTYLATPYNPSQEDIIDFETGHGICVSGGFVVGGGACYSPCGPELTKWGSQVGLTTPGVAASYSYTFLVLDTRPRPEDWTNARDERQRQTTAAAQELIDLINYENQIKHGRYCPQERLE